MAWKPNAIQPKVKFEEFELDLRLPELRRFDRVLKLERIPTELLVLLVEQRDKIVTREQIVERIWGKAGSLDTDNSINGAIRKIRQVLRDSSGQPRFVQTITGKGYRFIATLSENAAAGKLLPPSTEVPVGPPQSDRRILWRWAVPLAAVGVLTGAFWIYWRSSYPRLQSATPGTRLMLAVLPFENLTGDAGQDYFTDGLTEEMITQLGSLDPQHLGVIARTSVMHYKNSPEKLDQIGRELGVQYVLEGSIRRDSEKVRITVQLIQAKEQTHLWARQYDRELSHLLALEGEIATEIADEIQATLGDRKPIPRSTRPSLSPKSYESYDLYLKGQYFFNQRTGEGFRRAIAYFQQATADDPSNARAFAGLADSYALVGGYTSAPQTVFMPKARAAALRAVELDNSLPEAHTALALIVQNYDWDWQTAEKEFRRAIELDPNYAMAHHWYAEHLTWRGRFDEAFLESERARQLDPLSLIIATDNAAIFYYSRQYDRAIAQFLAVREMDPDFPHSTMIVYAYAQKGMFAKILAETERARRAGGDAPWICSEEAYAYQRNGQLTQARLALAKLEQWSRRQPIDPAVFVGPYLAMGNNDQVFFWLDRAYTQHSNAMTWLKVDPSFDPLRSDPRFQELLHRVGLAQ